MDQTFPKHEKLKSKKMIEHLFAHGKSCTVFPLKLIYSSYNFDEDVPIQMGVSVSKRNVKLAVKRNRIKRLLREAYRLNKHLVFNEIEGKYVGMILYLGKEKPNFQEVNLKMERLLHRFLETERASKK